MHRCLTIFEAQHAIFQQFHDDPERKVTLARLARTCRTLSNVALDVLWEELASITYLMSSSRPMEDWPLRV
ncbi:hypothetical protein JVU11DRAFT_841 [Chiua virens]|nr:hypothetical protein JVU11DRAFT_841 [Chiua virens]